MTTIPHKLNSRKDEIAASFMALVDQHMEELMAGKAKRRMSAADFAGLLFIAPRHLTNTLKAALGRSPCDVMENRILNEASKLLNETDLSVADIAYKFGYQEPTNFIKFFKGMSGVTPLQYRKVQKLAS